jgi:hypothetical protein
MLRGARLNVASQAPVAGNALSAAAAKAALVCPRLHLDPSPLHLLLCSP